MQGGRMPPQGMGQRPNAAPYGGSGGQVPGAAGGDFAKPSAAPM